MKDLSPKVKFVLKIWGTKYDTAFIKGWLPLLFFYIFKVKFVLNVFENWMKKVSNFLATKKNTSIITVLFQFVSKGKKTLKFQWRESQKFWVFYTKYYLEVC